MSGKTLLGLIAFIILITLFEWWMWKDNFISSVNIDLEAKKQCIKNNGIPITDRLNEIIDCKIYIKPTLSIPTMSPTPTITFKKIK